MIIICFRYVHINLKKFTKLNNFSFIQIRSKNTNYLDRPFKILTLEILVTYTKCIKCMFNNALSIYLNRKITVDLKCHEND